MKISLKCRCGSSIDLEDSANTSVNEASYSNKDNAQVLIQRIANQWGTVHSSCNMLPVDETNRDAVIAAANILRSANMLPTLEKTPELPF